MFKKYYDYSFLYELIARMIPENSSFVELGCLQGYSLYNMCLLMQKYSKKNKLYGVDIFNNYELLGRKKEIHDPNNITTTTDEVFKNVSKSNYGNFTLIQSTTDNAVKTFKNKSIFAVFVDAGHTYDDVMTDLINYYPLIMNGGYLTGHDIKTTPVRKAFDKFVKTNNIKDYVIMDEINCFMIKKTT